MRIKILSYNVDENFDKKILKELPTEMDIPDGEDVEDYVSDQVGVPLYEYITI